MQKSKLKELRISKHLTQQEVAKRLGVSLRSYISYELDKTKSSSIKYKYMLSELEKINAIDEEQGILSKKEIVRICIDIFSKYKIEYSYLFGSYAKDKATEKSDVDILVSSNIIGLKYYELVEKLREALHKKVDLIDTKQLLKNETLLNEVLKDGIKIYG